MVAFRVSYLFRHPKQVTQRSSLHFEATPEKKKREERFPTNPPPRPQKERKKETKARTQISPPKEYSPKKVPPKNEHANTYPSKTHRLALRSPALSKARACIKAVWPLASLRCTSARCCRSNATRGLGTPRPSSASRRVRRRRSLERLRPTSRLKRQNGQQQASKLRVAFFVFFVLGPPKPRQGFVFSRLGDRTQKSARDWDPPFTQASCVSRAQIRVAFLAAFPRKRHLQRFGELNAGGWQHPHSRSWMPTSARSASQWAPPPVGRQNQDA